MPPALLQALSAQLECGYIGPEAVRADRYDRYILQVELMNLYGGSKSERWRPISVQSKDEREPPAGWTQEDVLEAKNLRLEALADSRSGVE